MNSKKIVAIWAPLRYANVGDDMQAIAFAMYIRELGYDVKLYQLDEELAQLYNLKSVSTVDELCQDVNLVIIAGGALLTPFKWYKRILNKAAREYEADFKNLFMATKKFPNVKFWKDKETGNLVFLLAYKFFPFICFFEWYGSFVR